MVAESEAIVVGTVTEMATPWGLQQMPTERKPANPLPPHHIPAGGLSFRVRDGDN